MKKHPVFVLLVLGLIYFSLFCYAQDVTGKKEQPVVAESTEQLVGLILSALSENDSQRLEKIITINKQLIKENKLLTIQICGTLLNEAVEKELAGQIKLGNNYLQIARIVAKIYEDASYNKYLLDKVEIYCKWSKEEKEKYLEAETLFGQGEELDKGYKYDAAVDFYNRSLSLYREIGYKGGEADCLQSLGDVHRMLSEYEKARSRFESGLVIFREIKNRLGEAHSLQSLGEVHRMLAEYEKARSRYEAGLVIFREIKERLGEANSLQQLGDVHQMLSEYEKARSRYEAGLVIFREIKNRLGEANSLQHLGDVHILLSEYEKARNRYESGLVIYREIKERLGEANSLQHLGDVHILLSEYEKARSRYESGLMIFSEIKNRLGEANSLRRLGNVHRMLSEYEKARSRYESGLVIYREIKERLGEANSLRSLGNVHVLLSEYEKARSRYESGLVIFREINHRLGEANCLRNLGDVHMSLSEYEQARSRYEEALAIQKEILDRHGMLWSYYRLGQTFEALKKFPEAEENYIKSIEVIEDVWEDMKVEEIKTAYFGSKVLPYERLINLLFNQGKGEAAFPYAERSKARSFLYLMGNKRVDPKKGVPLKLVREEEELRQQIRRVSSQKLKTGLLQLKQEHGKIMERIKRISPEYASLVSVNPLTVEEIQTLIRAEGNIVIIEYYTTRNATFLWLLDGDRMYPHKIDISEKELDNKIREYHTMVSNPSFGVETLGDRARELYQLLLEPVKEQIKGKKHIGIIPHGRLHHLPFETLMKDGEFLVRQNTKIFYLPSASTYKYCKEKNTGKKEQLIAVGNPDGSLLFSGKEVEELKRLYPKDTEIFTGDQARESRAKYYAPYPDIYHFACHGSFNVRHPMYTALHLAPDSNDDGNLEVHEIYQLQLKPAYLVTLSACQTNLGGIKPGDEIIGLTRAFIYAGTSGILASLWKVDDYYTEKFMVAFYRALKNSTKIDALHTARQTMIDRYGKKHPFYWAAFVLIGDPR